MEPKYYLDALFCEENNALRRWWTCAGVSCREPQCECKLKNRPRTRTPEFARQKHVLPKLRPVR